jgi:hypothetical protein
VISTIEVNVRTRSMKLIHLVALMAASIFGLPLVQAEPTTAPLSVVNIRPYMNNGGVGAVYFTVDSVALCNTSTYVIDLAWGGSKQAVATLMLAFAGNNRVQIEIDNAGRATPSWSTKVQSIYIVR